MRRLEFLKELQKNQSPEIILSAKKTTDETEAEERD
jgi:hypothetical protein